MTMDYAVMIKGHNTCSCIASYLKTGRRILAMLSMDNS